MSFLKYWDVNNLHDSAVSQTLPVNDFKWVEEASEFNENFVKSYNDERFERSFLEVDVQYPQNLHNLHNDFPSLPERMKIKRNEILLENLHNKEEYVLHMRNLKQGLNHGLVLKKAHSVIKFNQKACLKQYIDTNAQLN